MNGQNYFYPNNQMMVPPNGGTPVSNANFTAPTTHGGTQYFPIPNVPQGQMFFQGQVPYQQGVYMMPSTRPPMMNAPPMNHHMPASQQPHQYFVPTIPTPGAMTAPPPPIPPQHQQSFQNSPPLQEDLVQQQHYSSPLNYDSKKVIDFDKNNTFNVQHHHSHQQPPLPPPSALPRHFTPDKGSTIHDNNQTFQTPPPSFPVFSSEMLQQQQLPQQHRFCLPTISDGRPLLPAEFAGDVNSISTAMSMMTVVQHQEHHQQVNAVEPDSGEQQQYTKTYEAHNISPQASFAEKQQSAAVVTDTQQLSQDNTSSGAAGGAVESEKPPQQLHDTTAPAAAVPSAPAAENSWRSSGGDAANHKKANSNDSSAAANSTNSVNQNSDGKNRMGPRKAESNNRSTICYYCKLKNVSEHEYTSHNTLDISNKVVCPRLKEDGCVLCADKGPDAHPEVNCKINKITPEFEHFAKSFKERLSNTYGGGGGGGKPHFNNSKGGPPSNTYHHQSRGGGGNRGHNKQQRNN